MSTVVVVTASNRSVLAPPDEASVVALTDAAALAALFAEHDAMVLVSDGFDAGQLATMAASITAAGKPVIEVRAERWDGETPSPVSAACRGVISGFGDAGIAAAVRLLQSEAA